MLQFPPPTALRKLVLVDSIVLVDPLGFNVLGSAQAQWTSSARMLEFQWLVPFPSTDARGNTGGISRKRASVPCTWVDQKRWQLPMLLFHPFEVQLGGTCNYFSALQQMGDQANMCHQLVVKAMMRHINGPNKCHRLVAN